MSERLVPETRRRAHSAVALGTELLSLASRGGAGWQGRPSVGCWIVSTSLPRTAALDVLTHRRFVAVDENQGSQVIEPDDLIMLWDARESRIDCLGPGWLAAALDPCVLEGRWLRSLSRKSSGRGVGEAMRFVPSILVGFGTNHRGSPLPDSLEPLLSDFWGTTEAGAWIWGRRPARPPVMAPELVGALHHAVASSLEVEHPSPDDHVLKAVVSHLHQAAYWLEAAGATRARRAAELSLERARDVLVGARQLALPAPVGWSSPRQGSLPLRVVAHRMAAVRLPRAVLVPAAEAPSLEPYQPFRSVLSTFDLPKPALSALLGKVRGEGLGISVQVGASREITDLLRDPGDLLGRFEVGRGKRVRLTVDDRLHRWFGVASGIGAKYEVEARCGGLDLEPQDMVAEVGRPVEFRAVGLAEGRYALRLTLHHGGDTLTRVVQEVEISGSRV